MSNEIMHGKLAFEAHTHLQHILATMCFPTPQTFTKYSPGARVKIDQLICVMESMQGEVLLSYAAQRKNIDDFVLQARINIAQAKLIAELSLLPFPVVSFLKAMHLTSDVTIEATKAVLRKSTGNRTVINTFNHLRAAVEELLPRRNCTNAVNVAEFEGYCLRYLQDAKDICNGSPDARLELIRIEETVVKELTEEKLEYHRQIEAIEAEASRQKQVAYEKYIGKRSEP